MRYASCHKLWNLIAKKKLLPILLVCTKKRERMRVTVGFNFSTRYIRLKFILFLQRKSSNIACLFYGQPWLFFFFPLYQWWRWRWVILSTTRLDSLNIADDASSSSPVRLSSQNLFHNITLLFAFHNIVVFPHACTHNNPFFNDFLLLKLVALSNVTFFYSLINLWKFDTMVGFKGWRQLI